MDTVDVALLKMDGPKQKYVWIEFSLSHNAICQYQKKNYFFFQVAQTNTFIATIQRIGRNDLVKEQMEKINWIRKTEHEYSDDF